MTTKQRVYIGLGILAVALIGVAVFLLPGSANNSSSVPQGYTLKPTVTTLPPNVIHPATPRPKNLPPKIYSTGACKTAMDNLRTLFDKYPSGLALDAAGSAQLTTELQSLNKDCSQKLSIAFRTQELTPWLTYTIPK